MSSRSGIKYRRVLEGKILQLKEEYKDIVERSNSFYARVIMGQIEALEEVWVIMGQIEALEEVLGRIDCKEGVAHQAGKSSVYDKAYATQYDMEQTIGGGHDRR